MSHFRITLYIPSAEEKSAHYIEQTLAGFAHIAGGASRHDISGAWLMKDGTLCTEPVALVSSIVGQDSVGKAKKLALALAQDIKVSMAQESVLVTMEPVNNFILV